MMNALRCLAALVRSALHTARQNAAPPEAEVLDSRGVVLATLRGGTWRGV